MDLNARHLAFLKTEMEQIKNNRDRDGEDRNNASEVLGRVEQEIEWQQNQRYSSNDNTLEIENTTI